MDQNQMLPIGTLLQDGKYRVETYLASGGFGNTYVVEHVKLGKHFALKEFFMRNINLRQGTDVTVSVADNRDTFQQMKEKFYKEAQRLARLEEPHIVEVSDFFEENQTAYYLMKLIDGESLSATMKRTGTPFTEEEAGQVLRQVLSALRCVHGQGLYHLDLKPGNIMRNREGHCWLIDFGASKQLSAAESQTLSTSTGLCFTPGYAPSEQVNGNFKRIGPWTDFYALGATLYNLLTKETPPEVDDITYDGEAAFHFPESTSPQMRQLILWLMSPRYDHRPHDIDTIEQSIRQDSFETVVRPPQKEVAPSVDTVVASKPQQVPHPTPQPEPQPEPQSLQKSDNPDVDSSSLLSEEQKDVLQNLINHMVYIEGGTFIMGEQGLWKKPHETEVQSFCLGMFQVTQEEWQTVMGTNPSAFKGEKRPVEMVSWLDCREFIGKLNQLTGKNFRLPTEIEWEYAARGGQLSQGNRYAGSDDADEIAWYGKNSSETTHEVGQKFPNELGLYDMSGNVWEWCYDIYGQGKSTPAPRVRRGGGCYSDVADLRVSARDYMAPDSCYNYLGLRLAL